MALTLGQLSSLDSLRGFVAVGRRMSVTLAAQDLCLTQSAVSRQIRTLEEQLGVRLFIRGHRSIAFTPEGQRLFRAADGALRQLQEVMGAVRAGVTARPVTVNSSIGVTGLWLLPRLGAFLTRHPNIDVRISASNRLDDLRAEGLDLAIRYCPKEAAPAGAEHLFGERVAPVAHPSLGISAIGSPRDIEDRVLLEYDEDYRPWLRWNEWLACQGWEGVKPRAILRFNQYDQTIQAAIAGQGIALGRLNLIRQALEERQLAVAPLPFPGPPVPNDYWLIRSTSAARPEVDIVADWIREEAAKAEL